VFAAGLVAGAYMTKVPPTLPVLRGTLGLTLVESSFIVTTFNVLGMLVGMAAGLLGDRFGHKPLALVGLAVLAAGGALGAAANGFALLLVSRFIEGIGFIVFAVSAPALMTAMSGSARDRAKALGLWGAYMPTGGTIALLLAPLVIAWSWRALWLGLALAGVVAALFFARAVPPSPPARVSSLQLLAQSLARPGNLLMALLFTCYVGQWTSVMVWLPTFLVEHGTSAAVAASATALMVLVNAPGNIAGGWLLSRGARRGALVIAACAIAALCEVAMLAPDISGEMRFAAVLVFSFCTGVIPASVFAGLPVHAPTPQHIATGNGMVIQASNIGQFFGPLAIAWIVSHFGGWQATLWVLLAFALVGALCGVALGRIEKRRR